MFKARKHMSVSLLLAAVIFLFQAWNIGELRADTIFQNVGIASSPNPVGSGARAVGMGGAFIGIADDATAASWNPGGLIQLERPEISIVGSYVYREEEISSGLHPESGNSSHISDLSVNYFSITYPFSLFNRNLVASVNYQRLYEFKRTLNYRVDTSTPSPPPLPSLLTSEAIQYDQDGYLGALGLSCAIEITPKLSFGMTLNFWTDNLAWNNGWKESYKSHSVATFGPFTTITDTHISDEYSDFRGENINLGLMWNVSRYLTIGAVLKTQFTAKVRHEGVNTWTQRDTSGNIITSGVNTVSETDKIRMPMSYGVGFSCRVSDQLTVDLDIYRTDWSKYQLTDGDGNRFSPVDGRPKDSSNIKDTTQARIGAEYLFLRPEQGLVIPIRMGFFYDPEPWEDEVKDYWGITLGSGIVHRRVALDAAYQLRWGHEVNSENLIRASEADVLQHLFLISAIFYF